MITPLNKIIAVRIPAPVLPQSFVQIDIKGDGHCLFNGALLGSNLFGQKVSGDFKDQTQLRSAVAKSLANKLETNPAFHQQLKNYLLATVLEENPNIPPNLQKLVEPLVSRIKLTQSFIDYSRGSKSDSRHEMLEKVLRSLENAEALEFKNLNQLIATRGIELYVKGIGDGSAWGGELELTELCEQLHVQFAIYKDVRSKDGELKEPDTTPGAKSVQYSENFMRQVTLIPDTNTDSRPVVFLRNTGGHYHLLVPQTTKPEKMASQPVTPTDAPKDESGIRHSLIMEWLRLSLLTFDKLTALYKTSGNFLQTAPRNPAILTEHHSTYISEQTQYWSDILKSGETEFSGSQTDHIATNLPIIKRKIVQMNSELDHLLRFNCQAISDRTAKETMQRCRANLKAIHLVFGNLGSAPFTIPVSELQDRITRFKRAVSHGGRLAPQAVPFARAKMVSADSSLNSTKDPLKIAETNIRNLKQHYRDFRKSYAAFSELFSGSKVNNAETYHKSLEKINTHIPFFFNAIEMMKETTLSSEIRKTLAIPPGIPFPQWLAKYKSAFLEVGKKMPPFITRFSSDALQLQSLCGKISSAVEQFKKYEKDSKNTQDMNELFSSVSEALAIVRSRFQLAPHTFSDDTLNSLFGQLEKDFKDVDQWFNNRRSSRALDMKSAVYSSLCDIQNALQRHNHSQVVGILRQLLDLGFSDNAEIKVDELKIKARLLDLDSNQFTIVEAFDTIAQVAKNDLPSDWMEYKDLKRLAPNSLRLAAVSDLETGLKSNNYLKILKALVRLEELPISSDSRESLAAELSLQMRLNQAPLRRFANQVQPIARFLDHCRIFFLGDQYRSFLMSYFNTRRGANEWPEVKTLSRLLQSRFEDTLKKAQSSFLPSQRRELELLQQQIYQYHEFNTLLAERKSDALSYPGLISVMDIDQKLEQRRLPNPAPKTPVGYAQFLDAINASPDYEQVVTIMTHHLNYQKTLARELRRSFVNHRDQILSSRFSYAQYRTTQALMKSASFVPFGSYIFGVSDLLAKTTSAIIYSTEAGAENLSMMLRAGLAASFIGVFPNYFLMNLPFAFVRLVTGQDEGFRQATIHLGTASLTAGATAASLALWRDRPISIGRLGISAGGEHLFGNTGLLIALAAAGEVGNTALDLMTTPHYEESSAVEATLSAIHLAGTLSASYAGSYVGASLFQWIAPVNEISVDYLANWYGRNQRSVTKRYRELSSVLHPDQCKTPDCAPRFLAVSACYELLGTIPALKYNQPTPPMLSAHELEQCPNTPPVSSFSVTENCQLSPQIVPSVPYDQCHALIIR